MNNFKDKEVICIVCPKGCHVKASYQNGEWSFEYNECQRGPEYVKKELTNPTRIITSTVVIEDAIDRRLPVYTSDGVPKGMIFDVMREINKVRVKAPIKMGDIIIDNILDTGVSLVASKTYNKSSTSSV